MGNNEENLNFDGSEIISFRHYIDALNSHKSLFCIKGLTSADIRYFLKFDSYSLENFFHELKKNQNITFSEYIYSQEIFNKEINEIQAFTNKKPKSARKMRISDSFFEKSIDFLENLMILQKERNTRDQSRQAYFLDFNEIDSKLSKNRSILIPKHSNITLNCLYFYPKQEKSYNLTLILKNNLTGLHVIPITGRSSSARIEISRIKRMDYVSTYFYEEEKNKFIFNLDKQDFEVYLQE